MVISGAGALASCGAASTPGEQSQPTTTAEAVTLTTAILTPPPTLSPSEQLAGCLENSITDEVLCAGAKVVVAADNETVSAALDLLDGCKADTPDEACMAETDLTLRALAGEDISGELGPGPDEVWGPDIEALQGLFDKLNQANDAAGKMGSTLIYAAATEPATQADPVLCVGESVDWTRRFGDPVDLLDVIYEETLVDFTRARRTDDWTVGSLADPDVQIDPVGRTYAFPMTTTIIDGTVPQTTTAEVHGHIGEDGNAYVFIACSPDYVIKNPNDTNRTLVEVLRRLDAAGIWEDYWNRPEVSS